MTWSLWYHGGGDLPTFVDLLLYSKMLRVLFSDYNGSGILRFAVSSRVLCVSGRYQDMGDAVRFIHASDIHLGSFMHYTGECSGDIAKVMRNATFEAFTRICDAALEYSVDFLVLSGDVYDCEAQSVAAVRFFYEQCRRLEEKQIPVYLIRGNHDPLIGKLDILQPPSNVFLFDSEAVQTYEVRSGTGELVARVLGQSYRGQADSRKMYSSYTPPDTGVWNIGLIHTQLDPQNSNYVPCSLEDLCRKTGIHYWALGHIHECGILRDSYPVVAYSGIPQGRDFGEQGLGGCLLVELQSDREPDLRFIPTSSVIWERIEVSIDKDPTKIPRNLDDLGDMLLQHAESVLNKPISFPDGVLGVRDNLSSVIRGYVVQWVITGRGEIHDHLVEQDYEEVSDYLIHNLQRRLEHGKPFLCTDSVVVRTGKSAPPLDELKDKAIVWRDLHEVINMCLTDTEMQRELLGELGQIWDANVDHETMDPHRFQVTPKVLSDIMAQAQQLIVERLMDRREVG
jgi:exonuclease SbcD